MVYQVVLSHSSSTSLPGSPNSSRKFGSPTRTKPLDMKIFIEKVLQPLSVEIARVMM